MVATKLAITLIAWCVLASSLLLPLVSSQGCSDTCPPLDDIGNQIESLCEGDDTTPYASKSYDVCHPTPQDVPGAPASFSPSDHRGKIIVLANFYIGCNAGRRESGVFAHVAQRYYDANPDRVVFVNSLKGLGSSCARWANIYAEDALDLYPDTSVVPLEMPLTVSDSDYVLRDIYFTTPFGHPSYVILDGELKVRKKFVGPCCGYETYSSCTRDVARTLDDMISSEVDALLDEMDFFDGGETPASTPTKAPVVPTSPTDQVDDEGCVVGGYSDWSPCSLDCGAADGVQFRWRTVEDRRLTLADDEASDPCPEPVDVRACSPTSFGRSLCLDEVCIAEFGSSYSIDVVSAGFSSPRDVAFHPTPGLHLGDYSEGRRFDPDVGEEAWVVNGNNHSVSVVAALGDEDSQTTISRRDRGYYHYMVNASALSFNAVSDSGRDVEKDSFNYWAVCNDNNNNYMGSKEPNYFMGPTLYNSDPDGGNLVNRLGGECSPGESCFFLHADMLHESPSCLGIVHDPEINTAFGTVFWAFDSTGDRENGQLVRFDFQQPHGPGSMDHSVAAIRRFPEVKLDRGPAGVHAGMAVHPERRVLYVVSPGAGTVIAVNADSGTYARTAREEYPIYSNRLPSFEYSVFECAEQHVFASGLDMPSGLALAPDGQKLFVAEHYTGKIHVYEVSSAALLYTIETGYESINGLAFSPKGKILHFVDEKSNSLVAVKPKTRCNSQFQSRLSPGYEEAVSSAQAALGDSFSIVKDYACAVNPLVPDSALFDQVHVDSGYASDDPNVQSQAGMDASAALLANRTDCEVDSELNFDALLLGGYYCHECLPGNKGSMCDSGGQCSNVQWQGYVCDNEIVVRMDESGDAMVLLTSTGTVIDPSTLSLKYGVTYRFSVEGEHIVSLHASGDASADPISLPGNECGCAMKGPLMLTIDDQTPSAIYLRSKVFLRSNMGDGSMIGLAVEPSAPAPLSSQSSSSQMAVQLLWKMVLVVGFTVVMI